MIFDLGSNFDSLNDDSRSKFIYIWLSVDDSRSRISSSFFFLFFYNLRSRFNLWLVTQDQGLILIERWFAHLWGINDWFWRLFLMCLWSFVHGKVCSWIFFIEVICGDSHCEEFFILGVFFNVFFFFFNFNFVLSDFSIVKICSMLILRFKNCFSLLVLRLKIFVLVIWLRVIGLGLDFKMDANSRLELGILIDSGSDLKFEINFWLWLFIWVGLLHN